MNISSTFVVKIMILAILQRFMIVHCCEMYEDLADAKFHQVYGYVILFCGKTYSVHH